MMAVLYRVLYVLSLLNTISYINTQRVHVISVIISHDRLQLETIADE